MELSQHSYQGRGDIRNFLSYQVSLLSKNMIDKLQKNDTFSSPSATHNKKV